MASPLQINQALYGYQDGHRLLASSLRLPPEAERTLLPLSDGPDRQVAIPSRGYLTGYPVPGIDVYALSRTWPAPEMPRPGCVWTHTLLIACEDLAALPLPGVLLDCFQRPRGPQLDRTPYERSLVASLNASVRPVGSEHQTKHASNVLEALYSQEKPVVVLGKAGASAEQLILGIWAQQWPRLRCDFRFASIATTREVSGRAFDLRLFPAPSDSVLMRAFIQALVLEEGETSRGSEPWLASALADLRSPGKLRQVLRRYAAGSADRTALPALANVYAMLEAPKVEMGCRPEQLLDVLSAAYPRPEQMRGLKRDLLGAAGCQASDPPGTLRWSGSDEELLLGLVASSRQQLATPEDLEIESRLAKLWHRDRQAAVGVLNVAAKNSERPIAAAALDCLLPLAVKAPDQLAKEAPAAVPLAINLDPEFAANAAIWTGEPPEIEERWGALDANRLVAGVRRGIVRAILATDTPAVIEPAFSRWGDALVGDLLDIAGDSPESRLTRGWIDLLRENSGAVSSWFTKQKRQPTQRQLLLVADAGDPAPIAASSKPISPWLELFASRSAARHPSMDARQLAFLFCVGIHSTDPLAAELLLASFGPLRQSLDETSASSARDLLGHEISVRMKQGGFSKKDKMRVEPISQALARKWRDERWRLADLVHQIDDPRLTAEVLGSFLDSKQGRRILYDFFKADPAGNSDLIKLLPVDWHKLAKRGS
jgi:hypothetical protein